MDSGEEEELTTKPKFHVGSGSAKAAGADIRST